MVKDLLKNSGLLVILAGVIVLGVVVFTKVQTNANLGLSLGLIVGGLLVHIIVNKLVD
jgi:uncharacterized protein (DUF983 family)